MILPILTPILEYNTSMFDCVSIPKECAVPAQTIEVLDYMVTIFPRNENLADLGFVYGRIETSPIAFNKNQIGVITVATELFSNSIPLGRFEHTILNNTIKRTSKLNPTLPGRK